jgi:hypothetical protein
MCGHGQSGIAIARRDDASASFPKMIFYVVGNQGFILDEKYEFASNKSRGIACLTERFSR